MDWFLRLIKSYFHIDFVKKTVVIIEIYFETTHVGYKKCGVANSFLPVSQTQLHRCQLFSWQTSNQAFCLRADAAHKFLYAAIRHTTQVEFVLKYESINYKKTSSFWTERPFGEINPECEKATHSP